METYKEEFIAFMVECGVLTFGDFTTKSGRRTPFFINTGKVEHFGWINSLICKIVDCEQRPDIFEKGALAVIRADNTRYKRRVGIMTMYNINGPIQPEEQFQA